MIRYGLAVAMLAALAAPVFAQNESAMHADWAQERDDLGSSCGKLSAIASCVLTLFTDNPVHITAGSIAPQNGVAFGAALVGHPTPGKNARITWSTDAVFAPNGSWRAGGYLEIVRAAVKKPTVVFGDQPLKPAAPDTYPVFSMYTQAISLETLQFYGIGPRPSDVPSLWSMRQVMAGVNAAVPVGSAPLGLALVGGIGGRSIRTTSLTPELATNATGFLQVTGGARMTPAFGAHVRPQYALVVDQFVAGPAAHATFTRWTIDVTHEFPFYQTYRPTPRPGNSPNDCSNSLDDHRCPAPSRDRYGAVSARVLAIGSHTGSDNTVPFYLQPTLGGSDINGNRLLASFDDYFFRAPNVLAVQGSVEHSLFTIPLGHGLALPLGGFAMAEGGRASTTWSDLGGGLSQSYSVGLTIRAGGFPEVFLLYAWGGGRNHSIASINPALLGGGSRPSLF